MEIDINQKKLSFNDKYQIFIDGQQTHFAVIRSLYSSATELIEKESGKVKYIIGKKWTLFTTSFSLIRLEDDNILAFRTRSFWKRHYFCVVGMDMYDIYGHTGRKYSVYKNEIQVAWWAQEAVAWFNGDNYKIVADKDCDYELIISFCLAIDAAFSNDNSGILSIRTGSMGPQAKRFDESWQPKY
jgi:uncharacterized protein YxjI